MDNKNFDDTAEAIPNYKLVDNKYYIKTLKLGKGNFAETYNHSLSFHNKTPYHTQRQ
jgi:hypothetical protein